MKEYDDLKEIQHRTAHRLARIYRIQKQAGDEVDKILQKILLDQQELVGKKKEVGR